MSASADGVLIQVTEVIQLGGAADQRRLVHRKLRRRDADVRSPRPIGAFVARRPDRAAHPGPRRARSGRPGDRVGPTSHDPAVQLGSLRLRLGPHLALERRDAQLVLAECRPSSSLADVESHQRPVDRLLQRIERQQADRGLDGAIDLPALALEGEQPREDLERDLALPFALADEPLLERGFAQREALEEIAAVERGGPLQCLEGSHRGEALQLRDVNLDASRIERDAALAGA